MQHKDIYSFITTEEANFKLPIPFADTGTWNMYSHVNLTVKYKNSIYRDGYDENRPFKNIIRPILNLAYRAEGFDVKDIVLFVNDKVNYFKSFLVRKFHEMWARKVGLDTFIDELVEAWVDFGGVLVKDINNERPEVVPWQRISFVDQTDVLSGPICEKHYLSPNQLKETEKKGWKNVDQVITLARKETNVKTAEYGRRAETPGKYIEVYELHGAFPRHWLYDKDEGGNYSGKYFDETNEESEDNEYVGQVHVCAFYQTPEGMKRGITLYKSRENTLPYKLSLRDKIFGRALGLGGAEELFQDQVWTNYGTIHIKNMLDAASKIVFQTTDPAYANRNKIQGMENLEITVVEDEKEIRQIDTRPLNIAVFENSVKEWEAHARQMGAANESILGESPSAGTPFKLQELITAESHSLHEYRKGQLATFVDEVYRDWIIPYIAREISKGQEFLAELDLEELRAIADNLVIKETNAMVKEMILNGQDVFSEDLQAHKQMVRDDFMKGGSKRFVEILKGELKSAPIDIEINIVGKQKDLVGRTDKLVNILRQMISTYNPQTQTFMIFEDPRMLKLFNQIIESSGLSPIDFYAPPQVRQPMNPNVNSLAQLAQRPELAQQIQ